jgi:hypothetical protein
MDTALSLFLLEIEADAEELALTLWSNGRIRGIIFGTVESLLTLQALGDIVESEGTAIF